MLTVFTLSFPTRRSPVLHGLARTSVFDRLFAREGLGSTAVGQGVAVPHGRVEVLEAPLAAFVRLAQPVPFDAPDGQPVAMLMCLLVPETATQQHLDILAELAQLMSNKALREALATETDPAEVHRMLTTGQRCLSQSRCHARSEERRVGKEWVSTGTSRWSPYH